MNLETQLAGLAATAPEVIDRAVMLGIGLTDGYAMYESPVGVVAVAFNPTGVSAVTLAGDGFEDRIMETVGRPAIEARPPRGWDSKIRRAIDRGTPGDLPVDLRRVSEFRRRVLEIAARIPSGEVRPYGWLATQVGKPGAGRAVGSTMATNPVPLIIPCHRVVRSDGFIGNYSLGGREQKWILLTHEGTDPAELERLAGRGVRFVGSSTTGIYCHPTCRHARRITDRHRIEIRSATEAAVAGLRPCQVCRP